MLVDDLIFEPECSLVNQAYQPRMLDMLSLAGFGMMAWDSRSHQPEIPFRYWTPALPVFDRNLKALAGKIQAECLLAHVRGVPYRTEVAVSQENTHPFCYPGTRVALAHNGDIYGIAQMRPDLLSHIKPQFAAHISGSTDSEWIYALLLSQLGGAADDPEGHELMAATEATLGIIGDVRRKHGICVASSVNLFISNGASILCTRYCYDFGCYPPEGSPIVSVSSISYLTLWYTIGREYGFHEGEWKMIGGEDTADSVIFASEPLTTDTSTWLEVPEYSMVYAETLGDIPSVDVVPLNL